MSLARRFALAALVALLIGGATAAQELDAEKGLQALDRGDLEVAKPLLARAAAESMTRLAEAQRGEAQKATLARALELAPADAEPLRLRIRALQQLAEGSPAEAATTLADLAARAPRDKRVQFLLGTARSRANDLPGAIGALRAATALDPGYTAALLSLGDVLREVGDFGGAFNAYNHAVGPDGTPTGGLVGRAATRLLLGDEEGALPDLELAARAAPAGAERSRAWMGYFYLKAYERRLDEGVDRVERAVAMWSDLARPDMVAAVCNAAGRVYLETGDANNAERWYQRGWEAIQASQISAEERILWQVRMLHGTARIAAQRRDLARADELVAQVRQLMDSDAQNADHYKWVYPYLTAYVELARRDFDAAIAQLQTVPAAEMERPYLRYMMAEAYFRKRDRANARHWYELALSSSAGLDAESVIVRPLAAAWLAKNPAKP